MYSSLFLKNMSVASKKRYIIYIIYIKIYI